MEEKQVNYYKDMDKKELEEQYEYLQEWNQKHPNNGRTHKKIKQFIKGICSGFRNATKGRTK